MGIKKIATLIPSIALAANMSAAYAANELSVSLEATPYYDSDAPLTVILSVTNTSSDTPISILKYLVADNGHIDESLMSVTINGMDVEHIGRHYKRAEPTAKDFISIPPGETLSRAINLQDQFDFSITAEYDIQYTGDIIPGINAKYAADSKREQEGKSEALNSKVVTASIEARLSDILLEKTVIEGMSADGSITFSGQCTSQEQNDIIQSIEDAKAITKSAYNQLTYFPESDKANSPRYKTWFGAYDQNRWETVRSNFDEIFNAFDTKTVNVDCSCDDRDGTFAYVYSSRHYEIYVCGAYWNAPMVGYNSKSGTMVHEMSHFNIIAGTDDHAYGHSRTQDLARNEPEKAISNADNHEYYTENTPVISEQAYGPTTEPTPTVTPTPVPQPSSTPVATPPPIVATPTPTPVTPTRSPLPEPATQRPMTSTPNCVDGAIDFNNALLGRFGDQDVRGKKYIVDDGCTLILTGNTWKLANKITHKMQPTTVLEFEYYAEQPGEIQGILFDTENPVTGNGGRTFNVSGSDDWGIRDYVYTGQGEYQTIRIPVGLYFGGFTMYIGFANDDDRNQSAISHFRNVRLID